MAEPDHEDPTLLVLVLADLGLQGVARLLGVAEQHRGVGLVEDGVVNSCVSHAEGAFHHNHLEQEDKAEMLRKEMSFPVSVPGGLCHGAAPAGD